MRETKFRVLCRKHKKWEFYSLGDLICGGATLKNGEGLFGGESWQEFTGLKDKNAYEGDIVGEPRARKEPEVVGVVKFDEDLASFVIEKTNGGWEYLGIHFLDHRNNIVIGNVWENPDLLINSNK